MIKVSVLSELPIGIRYDARPAHAVPGQVADFTDLFIGQRAHRRPATLRTIGKGARGVGSGGRPEGAQCGAELGIFRKGTAQAISRQVPGIVWEAISTY